MALSFSVLTDLPTPPQRTDPDNFASRADSFVGALDDLQLEMNTVIAELNQVTTGLDQTTVTAAWSSGTTYDFPDVVAGSDGHTYRCIGTTVLNEDPTTDDGTYWLKLSANTSGLPPVGAVIAFMGGYFTNGLNGSFTNVIGNDASTVNALVNGDGWYVCDGSVLNLGASGIFNGTNRYLPNLTDDRFLMGDTAAGGAEGSNDSSHTHAMDHTHSVNVGSFSTGSTSLSSGHLPSHNHGGDRASVDGGGDGANIANDAGGSDWYTSSTGSGWGHNHSANPPATTSGSPSSATSSTSSVTENRPKFLGCFYLMRVV